MPPTLPLWHMVRWRDCSCMKKGIALVRQLCWCANVCRDWHVDAPRAHASRALSLLPLG